MSGLLSPVDMLWLPTSIPSDLSPASSPVAASSPTTVLPPIVVPAGLPSFPPGGGFWVLDLVVLSQPLGLPFFSIICSLRWAFFALISGGKVASLPQKNGESVGFAGDERPADRSWLGDEFGDLRHPESRSWVTFYSLIFLSFWSLLLLNLRFSSSLLLLWVLDWFVRWYGKFMSKNFILPDWIYFFM